MLCADAGRSAAQRSEFEFAISTPAGPAMPPTHELGDFQSGHRSAFQSASISDLQASISDLEVSQCAIEPRISDLTSISDFRFGKPSIIPLLMGAACGIRLMMMICFDRYYKPLIRTKATSPISLPARQAVH